MNRDERNERDFQTEPQHESPLLTELRCRLSEFEPELLAARFQRLYNAISSVDSDASFPVHKQEDIELELDCESCENLLDQYIANEIEGTALNSEYSLVWGHLQTCYSCLQSYIGLADLLRRDVHKENIASLPSFGPSSITKRLSFLNPQATEAPWSTYLQTQVAGHLFSLTFRFNPTYLYTLLSPLSALSVRTEASVSSDIPHLLLYQDLPLGHQVLTIEVVYSQLPNKPNDLVLQATLIGLNPLPDGLWTYLTWANQILTAPVNARGQVKFEGVSLTRLKDALRAGKRDFEISFRINTVDSFSPITRTGH